MAKFINVEGPEYRGAPFPSFKKKQINESAFEDGLRIKEGTICMRTKTSGYVNWISQEDEDPTTSWKDEVVRAFLANGFLPGGNIHVKFGSRDTGYIHEYDLTV